MTDDIVTRLRDYLAIVDHAFVWNELSAAADEIERLRAEYDRLLNNIQAVAQSPDSRLARHILMSYYPFEQNGVGTSITLKSTDEEEPF